MDCPKWPMYSTHVLNSKGAWTGAFSFLYILLLPSVASGAQLVQCCMAGYLPLSVRIALSKLSNVKTAWLLPNSLFIVSYYRLSIVNAGDNPMKCKRRVALFSFLIEHGTHFIGLQNPGPRLAITAQAAYPKGGEAAGAQVWNFTINSTYVTISLDLQLSIICDILEGIELLIFAESYEGVPKIQLFGCVFNALLM